MICLYSTTKMQTQHTLICHALQLLSYMKTLQHHLQEDIKKDSIGQGLGGAARLWQA